MSEAGLSFETATMRTGFWGVWEVDIAVATRAERAERLAMSAEVRAGGDMVSWESDGVVMAILVVGWGFWSVFGIRESSGYTLTTREELSRHTVDTIGEKRNRMQIER